MHFRASPGRESDECLADLGRCAQNDDLSPILLKLGEYDAIVLGTPVYWWHVNPQFKMLTDRLYCFFGGEVNPETGEVRYETTFPQGRRFVVVTSRGEKENVKLFPELYGYLSEWLKMLTTLLGASSTEFVFHCGSIWSPARNDAALLARAESIGASLV